MNDESDALVGRAIGGDADALKVLLAEDHDSLCRRVARKIPQELASVIDAEDVVQDVHVQVFRNIGSCQAETAETFSGWLRAIAVNRLRDLIEWHRAQKRGGASPLRFDRAVQDSTIALLDKLAGPDKTPSRNVSRIEAIQAVYAALADLPDHYREAIRCVHLEQLPVKTVAERMGRTERAVHGLCRRGMAALRMALSSSILMNSNG